MIEHTFELSFKINDVKNNNKNEKKYAHSDHYEKSKLRNVSAPVDLKQTNVNIVKIVLKLKCIISKKN